MNPQDHQSQTPQITHYRGGVYPHMHNFPQQYPFYMHMGYPSCQGWFPPQAFLRGQLPAQFFAPELAIPKSQSHKDVIVISDDEDKVQKKPQEQPIKPPVVVPVAPQPKKQPKILDLDQLEIQGRVYDYESSESPQLPRRVSKSQNFQKAIRQIHYDQFQSPKQKKKPIKVRKEASRAQPKLVKQVQIGKQRQQLQFQQSSVKTRLIRVYTKNEEKFQKLLDALQQSFPKANDEDVVKILNMAGKSYEKAISFVQENDVYVQHLMETLQNNQVSDDEESVNKK